MMVRRRLRNFGTTLPSWVEEFAPSDWPGDGWVQQWRAWQAAVTKYLDTEQVVRSDLGLWLSVMVYVYGEARRFRMLDPLEYSTPSVHVSAPSNDEIEVSNERSD